MKLMLEISFTFPAPSAVKFKCQRLFFSTFATKFKTLNPLKRLAGQTAIYGLSSIAGRLLNYLLVPLYTRVLITSEYGIVTEMYAYVSILWVMLTYGMETTFFRFSESEKNKATVYSTAFSSLVFSSLVFGFIVLFNSQAIANWLGYPGNRNYVIWFGLILAFDAITAIPFAKLRQQNRPVRFATIKLINIGLNIGFNLFFILLCPYIADHHPDTVFSRAIETFFNPEMLVGYIFVSNLIASAITLLLLLPEIPLRSFHVSFSLLKKMLAYTWPLLVVAIAGSINLSLDKILLPRLLPPGTDVMSQVGIYGACYKVSIIMMLFIQTFRYAADPFFFAEAGKSDSRKIYADVLNYFTIAVAFIFLVVTLYLDFVIKFIGEAYREGADVVPVLLLGNLFLGIFYNLSFWYKLTNKTIYGALLSAVGAGITIALNFLLIPKFGYYGSAWAAFFAYFAMMALSYLIGKRHFKVPYNLQKFFLYLGLAVGLFLVNNVLPYPSQMIKYLVNTVLLLIFGLVVFYGERKSIVGQFMK
jgi:O-antigen/teichoic acid export membrane protein